MRWRAKSFMRRTFSGVVETDGAYFGGYVADRVLGYQRSILIGAVFMAAGQARRIELAGASRQVGLDQDRIFFLGRNKRRVGRLGDEV